MTGDRAALSSVATTIEDLTRRITEVADRYVGTPREDVASGLYDVERGLRAASRRLERLLDRLDT